MKIYTFSILYNTFESYEDKLPYVVAIVEDEEGNRYSANILNFQDGDKVEVGMEVKQTGVTEEGYLLCELA